MKNISIIAAVGKNLELGKNNELIWRLKGDMQFFKEQTMKKPIVMGLNTFNSLPGLLSGRKHIVLTHQNISLPSEVLIMHSVDETLDYITNYQDEVMIIGGASIYKQFLPHSEKLILTEIDGTDKDADTLFPKCNKDEYDSMIIGINEEKGIKYKHLVYRKK